MPLQQYAKKILIVMPHYFNLEIDHPNKTKEIRSFSIVRSVMSLVQQFGHDQMYLDFSDHTASYVNECQNSQCDIYICTSSNHHLLNELETIKGLYHHIETDAHPRQLGFASREVLKAFAGKYDYYCYVEDDLYISDPLFFNKLAWFNEQAGFHCLLQPNRCETSYGQSVKKCYIDGEFTHIDTPYFNNDLKRLSFSALGSELNFRHASNPHSGCYFLNAVQFEYWLNQPHFSEWDMSWIGPLESAASLGIMKTFIIYKPDWQNANFLEINHFGDAYLQTIGDAFVVKENHKSQRIPPKKRVITSTISTESCPSLIISKH